MYEQSRPRRNPTRYLAPLALAAILLATYFVVQHALNTGSSSSTSTTSSTTGHKSSSTGPSATTKTGSVKAKSYLVRSGDSLSVISARTGVPLPALETLNPGVSSSSLQPGQRLRLRR